MTVRTALVIASAFLCVGLPAADPRFVSSLSTVASTWGGRVAWHPVQADLLAIDKVNGTYYDVYTILTDGSGLTCLTCNLTTPGKSKGNPDWSPDGQWIVFQAAKDTSLDGMNGPGQGQGNDIWLMKSDGTRYVQVTNVSALSGGVLHAHFSHSGTKVMWAERTGGGGQWGTWVIKYGDFSVTGSGDPQITNIQTMPLGDGLTFHETHSFTPADDRILYSAGDDSQHLDIYIADFPSGANRTALTGTTAYPSWNEHAQINPAGTKIVWISSQQNAITRAGSNIVRTDYWVMDPDGSNKSRLTYYNKSGYPESSGFLTTSGDLTWSPDGTRVAAYVQIPGSLPSGKIILFNVQFPAVWPATVSKRLQSSGATTLQ